MTRLLLPVALLLLGVCQLNAQEYRTIDGTNNNLLNPTWGAAHTQLIRVVPNDYENGFSTMAGSNRPNPRVVSNEIFRQDSLIMDTKELSDYIWVWGQFIDHDLTLVPDSPNEPAMIPVPMGDQWFDPFSTGQMMIPMMRSQIMPGTGTNPSNPREHGNEITAYLDGSSVYGSDQERADWLRTFENGKMLISADNLLPFNTVNGSQFVAVDQNAPHMEDPVQVHFKHFVAGDARANENPLLLAMHTLFVREHNRLCDELKAANPDWTDEQLYQHARRINSGFLQSITYNQWLPSMGVSLPDYSSYDSTIDPRISNLFSAAAFRMGHTLISGTIHRMDYDGNPYPDGDVTLAESFFNPFVVLNTEGHLDPFFKGMGAQIQQNMDALIVPDVRNFLFGAPGSGGLDLASINIQRGRERGIPDLNTIRIAFGLTPITSFFELTGDQYVADKMETLYGDINNIDAWVGMLAEKHMPGALFGETILTVIMDQFFKLREGDRFFYLNDPDLTQAEKDMIHNTMLSEIIERNTNITVMQENVFYAMPHDMICQATTDEAAVIGVISDGYTALNGAEILLVNTDGIDTIMTDINNGWFTFFDVPTCAGYTIIPQKDGNYDNGVTTLDMVLLRKHILTSQLLDDPIKVLAADANGSGHITTLDLVQLRKVILNPTDSFNGSPSWRFVVEGTVFDDPQYPWSSGVPETLTIEQLIQDTFSNFRAFKVGDLNFNADPNALLAADDRHEADVVFTGNYAFDATNNMVEVRFTSGMLGELEGYNFTLEYDESVLELIEIENSLPELTEANYFHVPTEGQLTTAWTGDATDFSSAFTLRFKTRFAIDNIADYLQINPQRSTEAVDRDLNTYNIELLWEEEDAIAEKAITVYSSRPNPFTNFTVLPFDAPQEGMVQLTIYDISGRSIQSYEVEAAAGYNEFTIQANDLNRNGIYIVEFTSEFGSAIQRIVLGEVRP